MIETELFSICKIENNIIYAKQKWIDENKETCFIDFYIPINQIKYFVVNKYCEKNKIKLEIHLTDERFIIYCFNDDIINLLYQLMAKETNK